jgi:hypothetical protein
MYVLIKYWIFHCIIFSIITKLITINVILFQYHVFFLIKTPHFNCSSFFIMLFVGMNCDTHVFISSHIAIYYWTLVKLVSLKGVAVRGIWELRSMFHSQITILILHLCKEILDLMLVSSFFFTSKYGKQLWLSFVPLYKFPAYYHRANPSLIHSIQFRRMYVPLKIWNIGVSAIIEG